MELEDIGKIAAILAPFAGIAAGGAWTGFKTIMFELKEQTKTLAVLGERSLSNEAWKVRVDERLDKLEYERTHDSGVRSVTSQPEKEEKDNAREQNRPNNASDKAKQ